MHACTNTAMEHPSKHAGRHAPGPPPRRCLPPALLWPRGTRRPACAPARDEGGGEGGEGGRAGGASQPASCQPVRSWLQVWRDPDPHPHPTRPQPPTTPHRATHQRLCVSVLLLALRQRVAHAVPPLLRAQQRVAQRTSPRAVAVPQAQQRRLDDALRWHRGRAQHTQDGAWRRLRRRKRA